MPLDTIVPPHGGQLLQIAKQFGIPPSELLDFSANINPEGPPPSVITALHTALNKPEVFTDYPDLEETQLKLSIASYAGASPANITVANGFVPLLETALHTLSIKSCLLPVPAFGEYRSTLERADIEVVPYRLSHESDFHYQPDNLLDAIRAGHHDAIVIANPQNPSGVLCDRALLITLIETAATLNCHVLLDEAFIDYAPTCSLIREVEQFSNLIVFRSVTKFHGMPGLRVAYAAGNSVLSQKLNQSLPPWPITTLAAIGVRTALADVSYAKQTLLLNQQRRDFLSNQINDLGFYSYPAAANFLLLRLPFGVDSQIFWSRMILEHKIVLRNCANFEGLPSNHLRCAVRTDQQNARLIEAFRAIFSHSIQ